MHFTVNKKTLLDNISIVLRAVNPNSPLPALHNIKLSVKSDSLQLTASDGDISIQTTIYKDENNNLSVFDEGDILLDSKYLADMVRKIDSEDVEVEILDGYLTSIRGTSVNFELNGNKTDLYPSIDFSKPEESFTLKAEDLKTLVNQTCFAASDKESRPALTGLNMNCDDLLLTCVATDSYRLAQKNIKLSEPHNFNITVPSKDLIDIARIINTDTDVEISLNDKKILFVIDNTYVQTRLIDGLYPETSKLIPSGFQYELTIDAKDLLSALDRASFIKSEGQFIARVQMNENEIVINSKSNEVVSEERLAPISYTGDNLSISFKGNYVYDALRALNAYEVKLSFNGSMKPFVIKSLEDEDVLQLVLPIKTYD